MLLEECRDGVFQYPESVSEDEYKFYKTAPDSAMKGFVGFACSFAGKWFGGYARDPKTTRNYAKGSGNSLRTKAAGLGGVKFECRGYRDYSPSGKLIYCDPPYKGTTKIFNTAFNSDEFWDVMRRWSLDNIVVISEYEAPLDFTCVLEIETKTDIGGKDNKKIGRVEKLFRLI